jgi:hypothetical protein
VFSPDEVLMETFPKTVKGEAAMVKHCAGLDASGAPWWVMHAVLERLSRTVPVAE